MRLFLRNEAVYVLKLVLILFIAFGYFVLQFDWLFENNSKHELIIENFRLIRIRTMKSCHFNNYYNFTVMFEIEVA